MQGKNTGNINIKGVKIVNKEAIRGNSIKKLIKNTKSIKKDQIRVKNGHNIRNANCMNQN